MITEIKEFTCEFDHTPKDDDILEAISLAKKYECIIKLSWTLKWSGNYYRLITSESKFEDVKNSLPKIYGI